MGILIGADIVPTKSNFNLFNEANRQALIGEELCDLLDRADYTIFNLEVPLTDIESPLKKSGPSLIAPASTISGIKAINPHFFTLGNNHILDQGEQGLKSTLKLLDDNKIAYAGVGDSLDEASKPYIVDVNGKKIGIYCCAEYEFSIATDTTAGVNPFDPLESPDHVMELKSVCDFVIVLYHGGKEHYRYPSPNLQKVCRKLVDKGADLVVCQHSHCIGCEEKYNGGTIVYGQGNFLFDYSESEFWQTSLIIELDNALQASYIPIVKVGNTVRIADKSQAEDIITALEERSNEILSSNFIETKYAEFSSMMPETYLYYLSGINRGAIFRGINKLSGHRLSRWLIYKWYPLSKRLTIENFIHCEAHRELIIKGLEESA